MKITLVRQCVIFLIAVHWLADSVSAEPLRAKISPPVIQPGQQIALEIRIDTQKLTELANGHGGQFDSLEALTGALSRNDDLLYRSDQLVLLGQSSDKVGQDLVWTYRLTTYEPGKFRVPPVEFKIAGLTLSTEAQGFEVQTTRGDDDQQLRPIYEEQAEVPPWLSIYIAVLAAAVLFIVSRMFSFERVARQPDRIQSAQDWYKEQLLELQNGINSKEFIEDLSADRLAYVTRTYLERCTGSPVRSWTTTELVASKLNTEAISLFLRWLLLSDLRRFAAQGTLPGASVYDGIEAGFKLLDKTSELR